MEMTTYSVHHKNQEFEPKLNINLATLKTSSENDLVNRRESCGVTFRRSNASGSDNQSFVNDENLVNINLLDANANCQNDENKRNDLEDEAFINSPKRESLEPLKPWDQFISLPPPDDDETLDSEWIEFFIKCFKILAYFVTFILVLFCGVLSKSIILLMTSMIKANRKIPICNSEDIVKRKDISYSSSIGPQDPERIVWIWCLFFAVIAPDIFAFGKSLRICIFKNFDAPKLFTVLLVFCIETLNVFGVGMLMFLVLPGFDAIKGVMLTNALCFVPGFLLLFSKRTNKLDKVSPKLGWLSTFVQFGSLFGWAVVSFGMRDQNAHDIFWFVPIALLFISISWWENFLEASSNNKIMRKLIQAKEDLETKNTRYLVYLFMSLWKIALLLGVMVLIFYITEGSKTVNAVFKNFTLGFSEHNITAVRSKEHLESSKQLEDDTFLFQAHHSTTIWILIIHVTATYLCYATAKFACKICIQGFSYAFPVNLTTPVTLSFLTWMSRFVVDNKCRVTDKFFPFQYNYWYFGNNDIDAFTYTNEPFNYLSSTLWVLCLASQIWITIHVWGSKNERLAPTERLFVMQMYNSFIIDQSLALNRRRINDNEDEAMKSQAAIKSNEEDIYTANLTGPNQEVNHLYESVNEPIRFVAPNQSSDQTVRIYACATMWHENSEEMMQFLKSVMRLDADQCARRQAQQWFYVHSSKTDYYEFETHIFFDDAFEQGESDDENDRIVNRFVKQLIEVMDQAASNVHECNIVLKRPDMIPTPYGGRLIWSLPGKNKLIAHMKDKTLIRHRKRWSQCMYLYYLLGYRIAARPIEKHRKDTIAENTFLLALDGDINFRPHAVHLLVDLMKKNKKLGAACGRIHPVGSGPMVWYQKFEYAVAHWLQKATEHVFGCVLCSPGCFSLFRARALMDDSVMHRYTTNPTEAVHYVQYDQGEDRWLCTLMLQQGWRVEYCAASDSYTHAPEAFGEFFTQRRRWAPSTMANIMDLLGDYKRTVAVNENISRLYIVYQAMLMVGTILSPGTIFLMVVGALNTVMGFTSDVALAINIIPILSFAILCFFAKKNDYKILYAQILSVIYALLMLAVLVGTAIEIFQKSVLTPNSIFFLSMIGSFVVAAIIHPQEFTCLFPLLIYLLCIPSMYLLLTIYSIIEMHVVSWGTREVKSKLTAKEQAAAAAAAAEHAAAAAKKKNMFGFLDFSQFGSKAGLFTCMCCSNSKAEEESAKLNEIRAQMTTFNQSLSSIKSSLESFDNKSRASLYRRNSSIKRDRIEREGLATLVEYEYDEEDDEDESEFDRRSIRSVQSTAENRAQDQASNMNKDNSRPIWTQDKDFLKFPYHSLPDEETEFWNDFVPKYLKPIDADPKKEARITEELKELRNKVVFAFGIMNVVFILFVFLLQMHKDIFGINIPFGYNCTQNGTHNDCNVYNEKEEKYDYKPKYKYINMDPIGLVLVVFFGSILLIQCIGMLMHRFGTMTHLLAFIEIDFFSKKPNDIDDDELIDKNAVNWAKQMQKFNGSVNPKRRRFTSMSQTRAPREPLNLDLEDVFRKRMMSLTPESPEFTNIDPLKRKSTIRAIHNRRNTVQLERKRLSTKISNTSSNASSNIPSSSFNIQGTDARDRNIPGNVVMDGKNMKRVLSFRL